MRSSALQQTESKHQEVSAPIFKKEAGAKSSDAGDFASFKGVGHNFGKVKVNSSGSSFLNPVRLQAKLMINQPGDTNEQEAGSIADRVLCEPQLQSSGNYPDLSTVQRKCASCEEEEKEGLINTSVLRKKGKDNFKTLPQNASLPISTAGGGISLQNSTRVFMENALNADFSSVRVHNDTFAERSALNLGAKAYTRGQDIYFAPGYYQPNSKTGLGLIAHELTHVIQQRNGYFPVKNSSHAAQTRQNLEQEAERVEQSVQLSSPKIPINGRAEDGLIQTSLLDTLGQARKIVSSGLEAAADYVVERFAATNALISQLAQIRSRLRGLTTIQLPRTFVVRMEEIYGQLRAAAPSWLPVPNITFGGEPIQTAAVLLGIPVVVILLFLAFLIVMWWVATNSIPEVRRSREQAIEEIIRYLKGPWPPIAPPVPEAEPAPPIAPPVPEAEPSPTPSPTTRPGPAPRPRPRPVPSPCPFPTGLTPADPIPMIWYKPEVTDYYPFEINVGGRIYHHDQPDRLPFGEPIGVPRQFWPRVGKKFQLFPEDRGSNADRFRDVLGRHGFNWEGLQADHVQDIQWEGPDEFNNLWPLDSSANMSAGARQNILQRVSFCEAPAGPPRINISLRQMKAEGHLFRWFIISNVQR